MQRNISFESDILNGLAANSDMLAAYVRAAISDQGEGVKVCWSLWPHLTPPAKVGGVARALVKMGLLVPVQGGVYQVVTGETGKELMESAKHEVPHRARLAIARRCVCR